MSQRDLRYASGAQKRQSRLLRSRFERAGLPKEEARARANANVKRRRGTSEGRLVSKGMEASTKRVGKRPPRQTKRRK
jgi:hypothetical protein